LQEKQLQIQDDDTMRDLLAGPTFPQLHKATAEDARDCLGFGLIQIPGLEPGLDKSSFPKGKKNRRGIQNS
jgi:hypothetical protein